MTRTIAALLAAATIAGVAAPAAAQTRYYARERLVGMPTSPSAAPAYGYAAVYSTTYSKCSGDTQSAAIQGCTRSDGQDVETSFCSASPQTVSRACTSTRQTCGAFVEGKRWDIRGGSNHTSLASKTLIVSTVKSERLAAANAYCEAATPPNTTHTRLMTCRTVDETTSAANKNIAVYLIWGDRSPISTNITDDVRFSYAGCTPN